MGILHPATNAVGGRRGGVLYIHPFAEEMNKSRRMAALTARAFADEGFDVLLMDLLGCGDSSGDFGDATWEAWLDDVEAGWQWLAARGGGSIWLWGLRVGSLLAAASASRRGLTCSLLFWQPVALGHSFVVHLLRSKVMRDTFGRHEDRSTTEGLLDALAAGNSVDVGGYTLSPDLVLPLDSLSIPMPPDRSVVRWVDISDRDDAVLSPAAQATIAAWQAKGVDVVSLTVTGPPFWQTQEISECTTLIRTSVSLLIT